MNAISKLMETGYSLLAILTMALGVIVAIMFAISLVIGGNQGESLAVFAGAVMNWGIRIATIATLFGILYIYLSRQHTLTMNVDEIEGKRGITNPERSA